MSKFIVFNNTTGEILKTGSCVTNDIGIQAIESFETALEVLSDYSDDTHYVELPTVLIREKLEFSLNHNNLDKELDQIFEMTDLVIDANYSIRIEGGEVIEGKLTDTTLQLYLGSTGKLYIRLSHIMYKDLEVIVNVT